MTHPLDPIESGNANLLLLASILDDADRRHRERGEPTYNHDLWHHPCGTPGCAIGHWLHHLGEDPLPAGKQTKLMTTFALDHGSWHHLFTSAYRYPETSAEAAAHIRRFVAARTRVTA